MVCVSQGNDTVRRVDTTGKTTLELFSGKKVTHRLECLRRLNEMHFLVA